MIKKVIKLFIVIFFLISLNQFTSLAQAFENFSTSYDITYSVLESGVTHVEFNVLLRNNTTDFFASSYSVDVGLEAIENVKASDPEGSIEPEVKKTKNGSTIRVVFNKRVVGKNSLLPFTVSFDTTEISQKMGKIWEVNIPAMANQVDFPDFAIHVKVPKSFGTPTYIKPVGSDTSAVFDTLDFTKKQLGKSGISIVYGKEQTYSFRLSYHLKNVNLFPVKTEIALPPKTNYQDIFIKSITPKPDQVIKDSDGNWLARYSIAPLEKKDVSVIGMAQIFLTPEKEALSQEDLKPYLLQKKYWKVGSNTVAKIADSLKTPEDIYRYVVGALTYDFSRVENIEPRRGAEQALLNRESAVCLEFTDLFIALARAKGIPAREIDGFAYTQNSKQRPLSLFKDVLHAWPQYYDKELKTWVMVDPTWENTTGGVDYFHTFDFDHIAFSIKGMDSEYPIPAGGYKNDGEMEKKDVEVEFSSDSFPRTQSFDLDFKTAEHVSSLSQVKGTITITNTGGLLLTPQRAFIYSTELSPHKQEIVFGQVLPFGSSEISFDFDKMPFLTNKKVGITITLAEKSLQKTVRISAWIVPVWMLWPLGGIVFGIFIIFISKVAARSRYLSFFRR